MKVLQNGYELEIGDKIKAMGRCFEVGKIISQSCYLTFDPQMRDYIKNPDKAEWYVEFLDPNGGYHNWHSREDGGFIIPVKKSATECDTHTFPYTTVTQQGYKIKALVQDVTCYDDGTPHYIAIVHREKSPIEPYVVCHGYDIREGDWGNGYYYNSYDKALAKLADLIR